MEKRDLVKEFELELERLKDVKNSNIRRHTRKMNTLLALAIGTPIVAIILTHIFK